MKPTNKAFRLDKTTKMVLATTNFKTKQDESDFRKIMIAAQVESERVPKKVDRNNRDDN